jgi:ketosteroid isomerase-like protein
MSTDQTAEQNGRTAMEFLNAFTSGDIAKAWSLVTDDFRWTLMDKRMGGGEPAAFSKDDYIKMVSSFGGIFPQGIRMEFEAPLAGKDRVAVEARSEGLMTNGVTYRNLYVFVLQFSGGRIEAIREYLDSGYAQKTLDPVTAK